MSGTAQGMKGEVSREVGGMQKRKCLAGKSKVKVRYTGGCLRLEYRRYLFPDVTEINGGV